MTNTLPHHVAFIMDGNGRWAEERGLPRPLGHEAGAETVRRVVAYARKRELPYLTLYAFSTENWSRPKEEVDALMHLLGQFIEAETPAMLKNGIALRVIGDMSALSPQLREELANAIRTTGKGASLTLTLAINYGGRDEIVRAARKAMARLSEEGKSPEDLTDDALGRAMDTGDGIPDPDLIVRTAGEMRLSNFLVWQGVYAELYFTERRWPEFSDEDFEAALQSYASRTRKFGGAGEST